MKIVILDGYTENPGDLSWAGFEALGELSVYDRTRPEQTAERIGDAEIVITNKTVIDEKVLSACLSIRYIGVLATGYNVVDTAAAAKRSIPVCNIPTYGTDAVAQYVFALLLECCHHVGHHAGTVRQGRWCSSPVSATGITAAGAQGEDDGLHRASAGIGQRAAEIAPRVRNAHRCLQPVPKRTRGAARRISASGRAAGRFGCYQPALPPFP